MKNENKPENKDPIDPHLRVAAKDKLLRSSGSSSEMKAGTPEELLHELCVHQIEMEMQNKELRKAQLALERSRKRYADLRKAMSGFIQVISDTGEYKYSHTAGHQRRTANLARALGGEMGLAEDQQNGLLLGRDFKGLNNLAPRVIIYNK
jgi:HD-GYP domain-containing protein (c-di-GMP phosphodiesterase class II)